MGYIIPVQPIQSQIYANRLLMDEYNFAYVSNIQAMRMKSLFDEHLSNKEKELEERDAPLENNPPYPAPLFKSFIHPNPVNLSPKIAEINGKGNKINLYI